MEAWTVLSGSLCSRYYILLLLAVSSRMYVAITPNFRWPSSRLQCFLPNFAAWNLAALLCRATSIVFPEDLARTVGLQQRHQHVG